VVRPKKYHTEEERREALARAAASTTRHTARPSPRGKRSAIGRGVRPSRHGRRRPRPEREDPRAVSRGGARRLARGEVLRHPVLVLARTRGVSSTSPITRPESSTYGHSTP
jgi:hypothetical protein